MLQWNIVYMYFVFHFQVPLPDVLLLHYGRLKYAYVFMLLLYTYHFRKYATICFIGNHRFETSKKRLSHLTFEDFMFCAEHMITNWSYSAAGKYFKRWVQNCCICLILYHKSQ